MCCSLVLVVVLAAMELTPAFGLQNLDLNPNSVEIIFMGDDSITVYADGQPIGTESCSQNSDNAARGICDKGVARAPADVEQLAIAGYDLVPNSEYGLIMSTSNGIYTNSSWKCKAKPVYNSNAWLHSNFDDSDWDYAEETDKNERHALPSDFHPKARWIWAKEDGDQMPIMCRFHQYRNKCNRDSCKNGGTCYRMDDYNYKCTCPQGITGKNCETDIVKCASSPCVNGGICLETTDHHYTCICKPGYEGSTCEKESDGCGSSPCQNGATCYKKDSGFMCQCKTGYAGTMCETKLVSNIDKCGSNPCHHGGSCQGGDTNGYTCKCKAGYTGNQCESYVNYCASKPCLNGATCSNEFDRHTCLCKANYVGDICESSNHNIDSESAKKQNVNVHLDSDYSNIHKRDDTDNCESKPCLNGGTCINKENMYICNCKSDYTGINCESYKVENVYVSSSTVTQESAVDVCKDAVCPLHSNCVVEKERINTYKCQCHPGWDDNADCEHKCSPGTFGQDCEGKCHCLGEEHCDPITGSCASGCAEGYSGMDCSKTRATDYLDVPNHYNTDSCASNPCLNDGTCSNEGDRYRCHCTLDYTGNICESNKYYIANDGRAERTVESDIDNCGSNPCHHGGSCWSGINGYTCNCKAGYTGNQCKNYVDYCASKPCLNGATCSNEFDRYVCLCKASHVGEICESSKYGIDSERAEIQNVNVHLNSDYSNIHKRDDTDNCDTQPCLNGGTCIQKENMYICNCKVDYTGINCESYKVENVYVSSSTVTQESDVDVCKDAVCPLHSNCVVEKERINTYKCQCHPGWDSNADCEHKCSPGKFGQDCQGKCHCLGDESCDTITGSCSSGCAEGYSGMDCSKTRAKDYSNVHKRDHTNWCGSKPCLHGATCANLVDGFSCICTQRYTGMQCENIVDTCDSKPCLNNARCLSKNGHFNCSCVPGYTGVNCETNINECSSNPCTNNGSCSDMIHAYKCKCVSGHVGDNCEFLEDRCSSNPCQHGGSCWSGINGYTCECKAGYMGNECEHYINYCANEPCLNGATCSNGFDTYICLCKMDYTGIICATSHLSNEVGQMQYTNKSSNTSNQLRESRDVCKEANCPIHAHCVASMDQIDVYDCLCDPGWDINSYCKDKCSPGTFGEYCKGKCHCSDDTPCDHVTGLCTKGCADGYWGNDCSLSKNRDVTDSADNTDHCADASCPQHSECVNHVNRYTCRCDEGWDPKSGCQKKCSNGTFGQDCENKCKPGWDASYLCEKKCSQGTFGQDCQGKCHCFGDTACDSETGSCPRGCADGHTGDDCSKVVSSGSNIAEQHLTKSSSNYNYCLRAQCPYKSKCVNREYGHICQCHPGWNPDANCEEQCSLGTFGQNCEGRCHCFDGVPCDSTTGSCPNGCADGYSGSDCSSTANQVRDLTTTMASTLDDNDDCRNGKCPLHSRCVELEGRYTCQCELGWDPRTKCSNKCPLGTYGQDCQKTCFCSNPEQCDAQTGDCIFPVTAQYNTVTTSNENTGPCSNVDVCPGNMQCVANKQQRNRYKCKCLPGWDTSYKCETKCRPGSFGQDCEGTCHCLGDLHCNHKTGSCPSGCKFGYEGFNCSLVRLSPTAVHSVDQVTVLPSTVTAESTDDDYLFSSNVEPDNNLIATNIDQVQLSLSTKETQDTDSCRSVICPIHSKCIDGNNTYKCVCYLGWDPTFHCEKKCSTGTFGQDCEGQCNCLHHAPCDVAIGLCPSGCAMGYWGLNCSRTYQEPAKAAIKSREVVRGNFKGNMSAIVAASVLGGVLCVVIVGGISIAVYKWRKSRHQEDTIELTIYASDNH